MGRSARLYVGGISKDEKDTDAVDSDLVQPYFERDQFDHPGSEHSGTRRERLGLD